MAPSALWAQLLLLGLGRIAATSPIDGLQKVLSPPSIQEPQQQQQQQRKLSGKFLHITGMCEVTRLVVGRRPRCTRTHQATLRPLRCRRDARYATLHVAICK